MSSVNALEVHGGIDFIALNQMLLCAGEPALPVVPWPKFICAEPPHPALAAVRLEVARELRRAQEATHLRCCLSALAAIVSRSSQAVERVQLVMVALPSDTERASFQQLVDEATAAVEMPAAPPPPYDDDSLALDVGLGLSAAAAARKHEIADGIITIREIETYLESIQGVFDGDLPGDEHNSSGSLMHTIATEAEHAKLTVSVLKTNEKRALASELAFMPPSVFHEQRTGWIRMRLDKRGHFLRI